MIYVSLIYLFSLLPLRDCITFYQFMFLLMDILVVSVFFFFFFAVLNSMTMNILAQGFLCTCSTVFLGFIPKTNHRICLPPTGQDSFKRRFKNLLSHYQTFCHPYPCQHLILSDFQIFSNLVIVKLYCIMVFSFLSLLVSFAIYTPPYFFLDLLVYSLCFLFYWVVHIFHIVWCDRSFCIATCFCFIDEIFSISTLRILITVWSVLLVGILTLFFLSLYISLSHLCISSNIWWSLAICLYLRVRPTKLICSSVHLGRANQLQGYLWVNLPFNRGVSRASQVFQRRVFHYLPWNPGIHWEWDGYPSTYWEQGGYLGIYWEQGGENSPSTQCVELLLVLKGTGSGVCLDLQTVIFICGAMGKLINDMCLHLFICKVGIKSVLPGGLLGELADIWKL